jgi:MFS transporter, AAHS family, 3-hydroxyphenylpropionic acid transporter
MTQSADSAARRTVLFCVLAAICEGVDLQASGVAAVGIQGEFRPTPGQLADFLTASTLGLFIGALLGGRLADSVGRKTVLVTSVALFGLFSLLTPLADSMGSLAIARLLTGLGLGGALPILIALVAESSPEGRRHANVSLAYSGNPIGGALISLVLFVVATAHWRLIFVVGGVLPLLLAPAMAFGIQESGPFQTRATLTVGSLRAGSFAAILRGGRAVPTWLLWISFFLGLLTLYLLLAWLPTLLIGNGLSRPQAALAQVGFNLGGALAALTIGVLLDGARRWSAVIVTFIALPATLVALAHAPAQLAVVLALVFLMGCAVLAAQAFLYSMAPVPYPTLIRGVGVGAAVAIGRTGSIVGPKLGGYLKAAGFGYSQLLLHLLPIVLLGSCCGLLLARHLFRVRSQP